MKRFIPLLEDSLAGAAAIILTVYGITKRTQFNLYKAHIPVSEMTGGQLMWAFYGYSKPYTIIIGILQIVSTILLIIPRTRIPGCLLATTILSNIILQDIFYGVSFHALAVAVQIQVILIVIMYMQRKRIWNSLVILLETDTGFRPGIWSYQSLVKSILSVLLIAFIFGIASIFL